MVSKSTIPENLTETDCNQKPEIQPTQLNIICIVICIFKIRKTENDAKNILQNLFEQQKKWCVFYWLLIYDSEKNVTDKWFVSGELIHANNECDGIW